MFQLPHPWTGPKNYLSAGIFESSPRNELPLCSPWRCWVPEDELQPAVHLPQPRDERFLPAPASGRNHDCASFGCTEGACTYHGEAGEITSTLDFVGFVCSAKIWQATAPKIAFLARTVWEVSTWTWSSASKVVERMNADCRNSHLYFCDGPLCDTAVTGPSLLSHLCSYPERSNSVSASRWFVLV